MKYCGVTNALQYISKVLGIFSFFFWLSGNFASFSFLPWLNGQECGGGVPKGDERKNVESGTFQFLSKYSSQVTREKKEEGIELDVSLWKDVSTRD